MKRIVIMLICLLMILTGCTHKVLTDHNDLKIIITSDLHYFLKDYYQDCEWFEESMLSGDGKMVTYADEILDAFQEAIIKEKPDCVLLTGDLTFNGEKGSHEALASRFKKIEESGTQVFVLPGNHDIDNIYTKGYGKDDYIELENIDASMFKNIYNDFGYDYSHSTHSNSLSYSVDLNDDYSLIMIDTNNHELTTGNSLSSGGIITDETKDWLKNQLESIKKENKTPIVAMHHNLVNHNELLNSGYTIIDNEVIAKLLGEYNVPFVLSGHLHCQNIKEINGIYDIASSSLLVAPLQYGVINLSKEHINYQTQPMTISEDSFEYFKKVSYNKMNEVPGNHANDIRELLALSNTYYFMGVMGEHIDELKKMEGYQYIQELEDDNFYKQYFNSMIKDTNNHTSLIIK